MFDIGFAELIIIGVVSLLVIGPERLPGTIRTASLYLNRIRRGFNDIKREVQQELHNDEVMRELREAGKQLKDDTQAIGKEFRDATESVTKPLKDSAHTAAGEESPAERPAPTAAEQKPE
jgi:sec-independent protein translocase protein TatB